VALVCIGVTDIQTRSAQRWVLILASAGSLMVALDQLVVATALTAIQRDLGASIETLEWTVNAYTLALAVLLIAGAALGDRYGRRRLFVIGLAIFVASSAGAALAPNTGMLIVFRAMQGAGSALVMPLAMALLTAAYPPERRGAALGVFTALTGLAVVGGPVVGGAITQGLDWTWIFWLNVPIGLAVIPLALTRITESYGNRVRPDVPGVLLAGCGMLGLVWGLVRANSAGWGSTEVVAALLAGAVLTALFVAYERRAAEPMVPMGFFRIRAFSAGNLAALLLYASLLSTVFFLAQYFQVAQGASPLGTGLRFLPWTTMLFVVAPTAGVLADRIGPRPLMVAGLAFQGGGYLWLAANIADHRAYVASLGAFVLTGVGTSAAMPALQQSVFGAVPSAVGKSAGVFNTVRQLGAVFGVSALAAVFSARGGYASAQDFTDGVAPALALSGLLALLGAVAALAIPARRPQASRALAAPPVSPPVPPASPPVSPVSPPVPPAPEPSNA
jgi:EmrB/QacA subfamily drug resistance transporter